MTLPGWLIEYTHRIHIMKLLKTHQKAAIPGKASGYSRPARHQSFSMDEEMRMGEHQGASPQPSSREGMPSSQQYPVVPISPQQYCHEYTTCIPSPSTPLHLRIISSHCEGVEIVNMENPLLVDQQDDRSTVSSLQCGSIPPDPKYDPARDPEYIPFIPPMVIKIRIKEPIPQWLRIDESSSPRLLTKKSIPKLNRMKSAPEKRGIRPSFELKRQTSCKLRRDREEGKLFTPQEEEEPETSTGSPVFFDSDHDDGLSYYTTPTELLSDGSRESIGILRDGKRKSFVRREFRHLIFKVLSKRKDHHIRLVKGGAVSFDLQRASGHLT